MINKKGQVGDTATWLIATIVIVVFLIFFIFAAAMLGNTKSVGEFRKSLFSRHESIGDDIYVKKTIYAYLNLREETSKRTIDSYLDELNKSEEIKVGVIEEKVRIRRNFNSK